MNYICDVLVRNNTPVRIISPSWTNNDSGFYRGMEKTIGNNISLKQFNTFGSKYRFLRLCKYLYSQIQLLVYLLNNTSVGEKVIVYHSIFLAFPLIVSKFIRRFEIILEVEEIYQEISKQNLLMRMSEKLIFLIADCFIFSTEYLNQQVNKKNKKNIIIHGTYKVPKIYNERFGDDKIRIVYSGIIDSLKGSNLAVSISKYLPKNYHIHIIGYGKKENIEELKEKIYKLRNESNAKVSYDGMLIGDEYDKFLQKCDIGLSTQSKDASYNLTSFPSKILSYLANGLRVVSVKLVPIETSQVGRQIFFYNNENPEFVAEIIMKINLEENYDSRKTISILDEQIMQEMFELLNKN